MVKINGFGQLGLGGKLLKALDALGLEKPTPVQEALIPAVLAGRDIQVSARTGSGKSAAFLLPLLQRMLDEPAPRTATRCLVLSPTRELALQLDKHCRDLAKFTAISSLVIVGGEGLREQQAKLRKNPEVVIGTPGRLLEHLERQSLELGDLEFLVLDEADRILDMGLRDEVLAIVGQCSEQRQTLMLSATLDHRELGSVSKTIQREPEHIAIDHHRRPHDNIEQQVILADDPGHKRQLCNWLLAHEDHKKALVFTNTRLHAEELAVFLIQQGQRAACLHGEMLPDERKRVMRLFRDGKVTVLVATDLAARGLDVPEVDLVINFAMARSGDEYVHRIGRTGRAGASGRAVSLIGPQEWNLMESIGRYLAVDFIRRRIDALPARFAGPVKKKKPAARAKGKGGAGAEGKTRAKAKQRHKYRKNIGKRRVPSKNKAPAGEEPDKTGRKSTAKQQDGLAPLTRKR